MMKRIVALMLCLVMLVLCLAGCAKNEDDKGAYIRMYISEPIFDLDPLSAFDNQSTLQVVSLLFEGLFYADENGKPKKGLVDDYDYFADEDTDTYTLTLTLNETGWSDGVPVSALDVQYTFRRVFNAQSSAMSMLYDIKNAREIAKGNVSYLDLGVEVKDPQTLIIHFEKDIDIDTFLPVLCSPALYPVRAEMVEKNADWAKSPEDFVCNGAFTVVSMDYNEKDGFVLERNRYYYRDQQKDAEDESVRPYRIIVDYTTDPMDQLDTLNTDQKNAVYYFGHIPLEARTDDAYAKLLKKADVTDSPSTHVYYLNQNAVINGEKLFTDADVRNALSLAIDREEIANAIVYAEAATALVPNTVLNRADKKKEFRDWKESLFKKAKEYLSATANMSEAKSLLEEAGVDASDYSFTISVSAYAEDHIAIAEIVAEAWEELGFNVTVKKLGVTPIMTTNLSGKVVESGAYQSLYQQALKGGDFEVIALDLVANSPTAFSYLAPFAKEFSGNGYQLNPAEDYPLNPHITGYDSEEYNDLIDRAFEAEKEKDRAELLHEAEAMLMEDMPVIPIIYNKSVSLVGKGLSKVISTSFINIFKDKSSFYCNADFRKAKLKNHWEIAIRDGFVSEKKDEE